MYGLLVEYESHCVRKLYKLDFITRMSTPSTPANLSIDEGFLRVAREAPTSSFILYIQLKWIEGFVQKLIF